uniref:SET domain-containing protein n=1 Tax=Romanomermis culicivorax TaxID=13658 RepID=A0A915IY84_ROMCU
MIISEDTAAKESLELENDWFLYYDEKDRSIRLHTAKKHDEEKIETHMTKLNVSDILKFDIAQKELRKTKRSPKNLSPSISMLCVNCGRWYDGLCLKHPLVFVREKIPKIAVYSVMDTFPGFLYLDNSTIPRAGKGVFSKAFLPAGLSFGPYSGLLQNTKDAEMSGYSWHVLKNHKSLGYIDAKNPLFSNWMRYVNCPRYEREQNMAAILVDGNIYYYIYKPIAAGQELMGEKECFSQDDFLMGKLICAVWYGKEYGMSLKIPNAETSKSALAPKNRTLRKEIERGKKNLEKVVMVGTDEARAKFSRGSA